MQAFSALVAPRVSAARARCSRLSRRFIPRASSSVPATDTLYDAIVVGGGHNGLIAAAYLAKAGLENVLLLERRHVIGGAAVTEDVQVHKDLRTPKENDADADAERLKRLKFKFSRCSYLAGLLRPDVVEHLELEKHGFQYIERAPSSFAPTKNANEFLFLGCGPGLGFTDASEIAKFSQKDVKAYEEYEEFLDACREILQPVLDDKLPEFVLPTPRTTREFFQKGPKAMKRTLEGEFRVACAENWRALKTCLKLFRGAVKHRKYVPRFYELFTGNTKQLLDERFESDILKAALATDSIIGSMGGLAHPGSSYVLLHHVMGEVNGRKGVWAYMKGGMGTISKSIQRSGESYGLKVGLDSEVKRIVTEKIDKQKEVWEGECCSSLVGDVRATGVETVGGRVYRGRVVVSNATPKVTFTEMLDGNYGEREGFGGLMEYQRHVRNLDHKCASFKINLALRGVPQYSCLEERNKESGKIRVGDGGVLDEASSHFVGPEHRGTAHFCENMGIIEEAHREAERGIPATRPIIEMTIPSAVDGSLVFDCATGEEVGTGVAGESYYSAQLFVQYAPYDVDPKIGSWEDEEFKEAFVRRVFSILDEYMLPTKFSDGKGFSSLVVGYDALSPLDLEKVFKLTGGSISHQALTLSQLAYGRPVPGWSGHRTPVDNLYLCGAGCHPGGGVIGAAGRNCAEVVFRDLKYGWKGRVV